MSRSRDHSYFSRLPSRKITKSSVSWVYLIPFPANLKLIFPISPLKCGKSCVPERPYWASIERNSNFQRFFNHDCDFGGPILVHIGQFGPYLITFETLNIITNKVFHHFFHVKKYVPRTMTSSHGKFNWNTENCGINADLVSCSLSLSSTTKGKVL